ncbi:MAG: FAD:protein FMN transferase [Saprospiraceae bacterium]|nr:FAD:protein FMN transferase [Saprospiraceae bacterium]
MGSKLSITCYANDAHRQAELALICWDLVDSLNQIFSDYISDSEARCLTSTATHMPIPVSRPLFDLIQKSNHISKLTDGHFDITVGSLTQLWRYHLQQDEVPRRREINQAKQKVDYRFITLQEGNQTVQFKQAVSLDFGGIAKGYIGDCLANLLDSLDIHQYLIDMGGDLIAGVPPPGQDHWIVKIPWFGHTIGIANEAVATSGPDYQFFVHQGQKYAHIIDPNTGWGISHPFSTTVIAPNGWLADGLASAIAISEPELSEQILQEFSSVDYAFGIDHQIYQSRRFEKLVDNISRKN